MNRSLENIYKKISFYPKGVSEEYLAVKTGFIKKPFTPKRIQKGLRRLRRKINWITVMQKDLVQREVRLQLTTQQHLMEEGFPVEDREYIYYSRLRDR